MEVAGSAVGVASLGVQVCQGLLSYYHDWKDYDLDVSNTYHSIEGLRTTLNLLKALAVSRGLDDERTGQVKRHLRSCEEHIDRLSTILQKLRTSGEPQGSRQKVWSEILRALYPFRKSTLMKRQEFASNAQKDLQLALQVLQFDISNSMRQILIPMSADMREIAASSVTMAASVAQTQSLLAVQCSGSYKEDITTWPSPLDPGTDHDSARRRRQPGTGQWFLGLKGYQSWLRTEQSTLLGTGVPGAGKTILTSLVVDNLLSQFDGRSDIGIAYIYCNFQRWGEQNIETLLESLLKQLCRTASGIPNSVMTLYELHKRRQTRPLYDELSRALCVVAAECSRVFIVVDALDEYRTMHSSWSRLLDELAKVQAHSKANIFVTTRDIPDITEKFDTASSLEIRAKEEDIQRYLDGQEFKLPKFVKKNQELEMSIREGIINSAQGVFLLAHLNFESFVGRTTVKAVRKLISTLPAGSGACDDAYKNTIDRIRSSKSGAADLAMQTLMWITCTESQLTTLELRHALAIEADNPEFDEEGVPSIEDILSACIALVTVDDATDVVRLVHSTANEYFERVRATLFPSPETVITTACLTYLFYEDLNAEVLQTDEVLLERLQVYPLYNYAAQNWVSHACCSPEGDSLILKFLRRGGNVNLQDADRRTPLHHAVLHSWAEGVKLLLKFGARLTTDSQNMTPLHYMVLTGSLEIAQILLDAGVHVDHVVQRKIWSPKWGHNNYVWSPRDLHLPQSEQKVRGGLTALHYAALTGSVKMTRFLIEKGADPNAVSEYGETPLHLAIKQDIYGPRWTEGPEDLSYLSYDVSLKDRWNDPDFRVECGLDLINFDPGSEEEYRTAQARVDEARSNILDILFRQAEMDFSSQDVCGMSLLHCIRYGTTSSQETLSRLLEKGVQVDLRNSTGQTALHLACLEHDLNAIKTLLNYDANILKTDDAGLNALHYAARSGDKKAMQLILDKAKTLKLPAFENRKDNHNQNALHHLLGRNWYVDIAAVEYLTGNGVGVNDLNDKGDSPLARCLVRPLDSPSHKSGIAEHLFKAGADPSFRAAKDSLNLGHLSASAGELGIELLQVLARYHVDLRSQDENGRTILHHCALAGSLKEEDAVKFLCNDAGLR